MNKQLTESDASDLFRLLRLVSQKHLLRHPRPTDSAVLNKFLSDPLFRVFGSYDENYQLCACVFVEFSRWDRSWRIVYILKAPYGVWKNVLDALAVTLEYAHKNYLYQFTAHTYGKKFRAWERKLAYIPSSFFLHSPFSLRYDSSTEAVISTSTRPTFHKYWHVLLDQQLPSDTVYVRSYSMKDAYRTFI